jgi:hypothetical protein
MMTATLVRFSATGADCVGDESFEPNLGAGFSSYGCACFRCVEKESGDPIFGTAGSLTEAIETKQERNLIN